MNYKHCLHIVFAVSCLLLPACEDSASNKSAESKSDTSDPNANENPLENEKMKSDAKEKSEEDKQTSPSATDNTALPPPPSEPPPAPPATIDGQVGQLSIDGSLQDFQVSIYELNEDGTKGNKHSSTDLSSEGEFSAPMPSSTGALEIVLEPKSLSLTAPESIVRSRIISPESGKKYALNILTELQATRMDKLIGDGTEPDKAMQQSSLETQATAGCKDLNLAPTSIDQVGDSVEVTESPSLLCGLYLSGLKDHATNIGVSSSNFIALTKEDFSDGYFDGKDSSNRYIENDGTKLFPFDAANSLRNSIKNVIKANPNSPVDYDHIPKLSSSGASDIPFDESEWDSYEPPPPYEWQHFIEIVPGAGVGNIYDEIYTVGTGVGDCIGPFKMRRTDKKGQPLMQGPELPVSVSSGTGTLHAMNDCTGGSADTTIAENAADSAEFYFRPENFYFNPIMAIVSSASVEDVEGDFFYLDAIDESSGKPIANMFSVSMIEDASVLPDMPTYKGDFSNPVTRDVCQPMVMELWRGTPYRGIFPFDVSLGFLQEDPVFPAKSGGSIAFYSDSNCITPTSGGSNSVVVSAGESYKVFYLKVSSDYEQSTQKFEFTYVQNPSNTLIVNFDNIPHIMYYAE